MHIKATGHGNSEMTGSEGTWNLVITIRFASKVGKVVLSIIDFYLKMCSIDFSM